MQNYKQIYYIGEDVCDPYGGAFKISKGLSQLFPKRVLNTPISENAIVGLANGLALGGYRPVVEIMFGDFMTLAFDQIINHAAKFRYMYNHQVRVPIIVRTPMGGGRGYGPTHSQTLDRHFLGIPGLRVMALNHLIHPYIVYETLFRSSEDPTIVIENKILYTTQLQEMAPRGFRYQYILESSPMIIVEPEYGQADLTIIAYGGLSPMVIEILEELFFEHDLIAQFICPIQIDPFDIRVCKDFIQRGKRLILMEEGQGYANFSSECLAQYAEYYSTEATQCMRIASEPNPIPSSKSLENSTLIHKEQAINTILSMINSE